MAVKWQFDDPVTLDSYTFDINPNSGGSPTNEKTINYESTCAPDGKIIRYEGREKPQKLNFSGTLLEEDQYDAFLEWYNKHYQIKVTDDLGREFYIEIDVFNPTRENSYQYPWKHRYDIQATIVDWP